MNKRNIKTIGCAVALSLASFSTYANTAEEALNACADALAGEISGDNGIPTSYRLDESMRPSKRRLQDSAIYHLDARDPDTNEVVARADCHIDARAKVRKLVPVPIDSGDATERSVTAY